MEHSLGERESDSSKASGAKGRAVLGLIDPHTLPVPSYNAAERYVPNGSHTSSLLQVLEKQAQRSGRNSYHPISSYRPMPVVDNIDRHI